MKKQLLSLFAILLIFMGALTALAFNIKPLSTTLLDGPAEHYQAKPIPSDPVSDWKTFSAHRQCYFKNLFTKELQKSDVLNEQVKEYVDHYCDEILKPDRAAFNGGFYLTADREDIRALYEEGDRLVKSGEAHPVLYYCQLDVLCKSRDDLFPFDINPVRKQIAEAGYEACSLVEGIHPLFPYVFCNEMRLRGGKEDKQKWIDEMHRLLPQIMYPENMNDADFNVVADLVDTFFRYNYSLETRRIAANVLLNDPKVPQWFGLYCNGNVHIDEGWEARGNEWASSVTDDGRKGFEDHLSKARESLTHAWTLRPDLPEAARKMITVSMAESIEPNEERKWFDRSISARVDYWGAYNSYVYAITPRWSGSIRQLKSFAEECLQSGRFDTCIPWYGVTDALGWTCKESDYSDTLPDRDFSLEMIKGLYEGYRSSDKVNGDNRAAVFSCLASLAVKAGDNQLAHQIFEEVDYKNDPDYLNRNLGVHFQDYVWQSWFGGSPSAGLIQDAVALGKAGKLHEAEIAYDKVLAVSEIPHEVRDQLLLQKYTLGFHEKFSSGAWVDVYTSDEMPEWLGPCTYWTSDEKGWLKADQKRSVGWLPAEVSFVDGFELELDVESRTSGSDGQQRAYVFLFDPSWHNYNCAYLKLEYGKNKLKLQSGSNGDDDASKTESCQFTGKDHVRVVVKNGNISVGINGNPIISSFPVHDHERYKGMIRVGLGDYWSGRFNEVNRFNNIRIRKAVAD